MTKEQELNKKLAEWAGFICYWDEGATDGLWQCPDEPDFQKRKDCPNFTHSLDACFRWLVPKLWVCQYTLEEGIFHVWMVSRPDKEGKASPRCSALDEFNPALALCLAIEKLIDKEEKND